MRTLTGLTILALLLLGTATAHDEASEAHYLANEGVMITHGDTKILFDPLFNEGFGQYRLLPEAMRTALMAGSPPWDGVDAIFISHYHDDHFAPQDVLDYLHAHKNVRLYAPAQAGAAIRDIAQSDDEALSRISEVMLGYQDAPLRLKQSGLLIDVVRIPHSGWPERRLDVENLAWRVTLDEGPTVLHLGDADTRDEHFARDADYWEKRPLHLALPPYWYFLSPRGLRVLDDRLKPARAVGVHVPKNVPSTAADRDAALQAIDLFTIPGERRLIQHDH